MLYSSGIRSGPSVVPIEKCRLLIMRLYEHLAGWDQPVAAVHKKVVLVAVTGPVCWPALRLACLLSCSLHFKAGFLKSLLSMGGLILL